MNARSSSNSSMAAVQIETSGWAPRIRSMLHAVLWRPLRSHLVPSTPEHVDPVLNVAENEMGDVERTFHRRIVL
jgi:hypothetical protein